MTKSSIQKRGTHLQILRGKIKELQWDIKRHEKMIHRLGTKLKDEHTLHLKTRKILLDLVRKIEERRF